MLGWGLCASRPLQTLFQDELKKDPNIIMIPIIRQNKSLKLVVGDCSQENGQEVVNLIILGQIW